MTPLSYTILFKFQNPKLLMDSRPWLALHSLSISSTHSHIQNAVFFQTFHLELTHRPPVYITPLHQPTLPHVLNCTLTPSCSLFTCAGVAAPTMATRVQWPFLKLQCTYTVRAYSYYWAPSPCLSRLTWFCSVSQSHSSSSRSRRRSSEQIFEFLITVYNRI
jgi:hypothetical protein